MRLRSSVAFQTTRVLRLTCCSKGDLQSDLSHLVHLELHGAEQRLESTITQFFGLGATGTAGIVSGQPVAAVCCSWKVNCCALHQHKWQSLHGFLLRQR